MKFLKSGRLGIILKHTAIRQICVSIALSGGRASVCEGYLHLYLAMVSVQ